MTGNRLLTRPLIKLDGTLTLLAVLGSRIAVAVDFSVRMVHPLAITGSGIFHQWLRDEARSRL